MAQIGLYAPNRLSARALPQTHWGSLHRSPDPLAGLRWGPRGTGRRDGRGKGGRGGKRREGRRGRPGMPKSRVGKPSSKFETRASPTQVGGCVDPTAIANNFASYFSEVYAPNNRHCAFLSLRENYFGLPLAADLACI